MDVENFSGVLDYWLLTPSRNFVPTVEMKLQF